MNQFDHEILSSLRETLPHMQSTVASNGNTRTRKEIAMPMKAQKEQEKIVDNGFEGIGVFLDVSEKGKVEDVGLLSEVKVFEDNSKVPPPQAQVFRKKILEETQPKKTESKPSTLQSLVSIIMQSNGKDERSCKSLANLIRNDEGERVTLHQLILSYKDEDFKKAKRLLIRISEHEDDFTTVHNLLNAFANAMRSLEITAEAVDVSETGAFEICKKLFFQCKREMKKGEEKNLEYKKFRDSFNFFLKNIPNVWNFTSLSQIFEHTWFDRPQDLGMLLGVLDPVIGQNVVKFQEPVIRQKDPRHLKTLYTNCPNWLRVFLIDQDESQPTKQSHQRGDSASK